MVLETCFLQLENVLIREFVFPLTVPIALKKKNPNNNKKTQPQRPNTQTRFKMQEHVRSRGGDGTVPPVREQYISYKAGKTSRKHANLGEFLCCAFGFRAIRTSVLAMILKLQVCLFKDPLKVPSYIIIQNTYFFLVKRCHV